MIGFLFQAWAAFSPLASIAFVLGVVAIVVAFAGAMFVPEKLKMPLIAAGIALAVGASIWQTAEVKGAHDIYAATQTLALRAETKRADQAEALTKEIAEQATKDLEASLADNANLKGLNDVLSRDPRGRAVALPADVARRLRKL